MLIISHIKEEHNAFCVKLWITFKNKKVKYFIKYHTQADEP
jgi:hypothetical protein